MKTLTNLISPFQTNTLRTDTYEVIENEVVTAQIYKDLNVSGSLFSKTLFKGVTFDSCAFYATNFIECEFVGCNFKNCTFQFSHFEKVDFDGCEFINNSWIVSSISKSILSTCFVDRKTSYYLMREDNAIFNCFASRTLTWDEVDNQTQTLTVEDRTILKKVS